MHRDIKALILQVSQGGCAFFAGKGPPNDNQQASITGLIDAAHHILAVAKSYNVCVQRLYFRGTNIRSSQSVLTAQLCCTATCVKKLLPWFDTMLATDEEYFELDQEPKADTACKVSILWAELHWQISVRPP